MAKTIGSFDLASLKVLRDDVTQYFWFEPDSSSAWGSGAHVTLYPESQFTDSTSPNYMKGQNIIMNTDGFSIRNGALPMMVLDNNSLDFNAVDTLLGTYTTMATFGLTGATIGQASGAHIQISSSGLDVNTNASTNIASFGTDGARIGKINGAHSEIDADGQRFYAANGTKQLANIGYGEGVSATGGFSVEPYYTLGTRYVSLTRYNSTSTYEIGDLCLYNDGNGDKTYVCTRDITTPESWNISHWRYYIGNYSMAEGFDTTASGYAAHAEGFETRAIDYYSHAEGFLTKAIKSSSHVEGYYAIAGGTASHAEGDSTEAGGTASHAEGQLSKAKQSFSHAQNLHTRASKKAQTAIGTYNEEDTSNTTTHPNRNADYGQYAFIIGNGTGDADAYRSNAFTVAWNGVARLAGNLFTGCNSDSTGGYEFGRKAGNHVVIGGIHICWGLETIAHTSSGYKEVQVTLPYTYTSAPKCFASYGNRSTSGAPRTASATQSDLAGNKIYVGSYATGSVTAYVNWMTIGV